MRQLPIILFAQKSSPYFSDVEEIISSRHNIIAINPTDDLFEALLAKHGVTKDDVWVISAENPIVIKEPFLSCNNFNIHRAPPWYPGWGGLVRALVDKQKRHGVVAHHMTASVDAGEILDEQMFDLDKDESFISLNEKTCEAGLVLLKKMCHRISVEKLPLVSKSNLQWSSEKMSMNDVKSLLSSLDAPWVEEATREYSSSQ